MKTSRVIFVLLLFTAFLCAQQTPSNKAWADWNFLLGEWDLGQGGGTPGLATAGSFSLTPELGGQILLRKNHAEYAGALGKPPEIHDDLMMVFHEAGATKALYSDNEGHIIHYNVNPSSDGKQITFLSEKGPGQPQYRLIYENLGQDTINVVFEFAPPNKPDRFFRYVEGVVHRKKN